MEAVNDWDDATKLKWLRVQLTGKSQTASQRLLEDTQESYNGATIALKEQLEPPSPQSCTRVSWEPGEGNQMTAGLILLAIIVKWQSDLFVALVADQGTLQDYAILLISNRETENTLHDESEAGGCINKTLLPYNLISPTDGCSVEGLVDDMPLSLLVDTGAAVMLVRKET